MSDKARRLENFALRKLVSADDRLEQYIRDCKVLPRAKKARFWIEILEADPLVRELLEIRVRYYPRRRGQRE